MVEAPDVYRERSPLIRASCFRPRIRGAVTEGVGAHAKAQGSSPFGFYDGVPFMDLKGASPTGQTSKPTYFPPKRDDDRKEVLWAFFGLILWSAVVIGGVVGAGHIVGHFVLHLW